MAKQEDHIQNHDGQDRSSGSSLKMAIKINWLYHICIILYRLFGKITYENFKIKIVNVKIKIVRQQTANEILPIHLKMLLT